MTILQESRDVSIWLCGGHLTLRKSVWGAYKEPSNGILLAMSHLNTTQYLMRMASRYFIFLLCTLVPWKMFTLVYSVYLSTLVYSVYFSARGVVVLLFTFLRHTIVLRHMENVFAHGYELD